MGGSITKVLVRISALSHSYPDDVALLLVGPMGQAVLLMFNTGCGFGVANVILTFDQSAVEGLPDDTQIATGTYRPTGFGVVTVNLFDPPAPPSPYNLTLDVFNGTNPNGTWRLFMYDDNTGDVGTIAGWSLTITTGPPATTSSVVPATTLAASLGNTVTASSGCSDKK
jgi:hypothetical protein